MALVASLVACASNKEAWHYDGGAAVPLLATEQFLPVQQRDETGALLPYVAMTNPYAELKGRIDKESVTAYIDARRAFTAKKYDFAEQLLVELLEREKNLSGPWVMRGDIALEKNQLAEAVEHYAQAIKVNELNFNAWLRLAKAQRMRGHFHHAQNTYAKALTLWRDGPELHLNLGVLYDLYFNSPLQAQAHMEAYQLLSGGENREVIAWLDEVRERTGVASTLKIIGADGQAESTASSSQTAPELDAMATSVSAAE